jgi:hypothetical protein
MPVVSISSPMNSPSAMAIPTSVTCAMANTVSPTAQRHAVRLPRRRPLMIGAATTHSTSTSGPVMPRSLDEPNGPLPGTSSMTTSATVTVSSPATASSRHSRRLGLPIEFARCRPASRLPSGMASASAKKCTRSASVPT